MQYPCTESINNFPPLNSEENRLDTAAPTSIISTLNVVIFYTLSRCVSSVLKYDFLFLKLADPRLYNKTEIMEHLFSTIHIFEDLINSSFNCVRELKTYCMICDKFSNQENKPKAWDLNQELTRKITKRH